DQHRLGSAAGRRSTRAAELEQAFEVAAAAGLEDHAARALVNLATITAEQQGHGPSLMVR
ncbi:MAG TPA: hypothetical protein VK942_11020, partial [Actinomycetes bacterium]|nr:hypothetical protein [Actinomycetes bacterium]